ncbi:MAG: polysaccharide deacetylase family protein [Actinomycetota bacterium]|nr:polysaccharide deacetylase family protein [Actinomycetota bacterium]
MLRRSLALQGSCLAMLSRTALKRGLAVLDRRAPARGLTILIYHRIGGESRDELDVPLSEFERQLELLGGHDVVGLDAALDALEVGDDAPRFVLTFDDGFADVHEHAFPLLRARKLPFTLYIPTAYIGGELGWEGSSAQATGHALNWEQLGELASSPLCTLGNHTHTHARPERLTASELDDCSTALAERLGVVPRHFAFPWGIPVPSMEGELRARFRSAVTGKIGRNQPGGDLMRLKRVPVRRTDPIEFFAAKLRGGLLAEHSYSAAVATAKGLGARA